MTVVEELRTDRESGARRLEAEYKAGLMTLARRFCPDEGDAEELVNRTLAAVVEGIDDYLEQSAFFGWMCKILENVHAKDVRRKSNRTVVGDAEAVAGARDDDAGDRIFREVDASLLRDAIAELPADLKDALMLRYFMDLPVSRVARILSAPEGTVKWRLHCARMVLAAKLGAQRPVVRLVLLALLLAAGLAVGRGVYTLGTAVFGSRVEYAEAVSHAESAEPPPSTAFPASTASIVSIAPTAPTASTASTAFPASTVSTASTASTVPEPSAMNTRSLLAATASLSLAAAPALALADGTWTKTALSQQAADLVSLADGNLARSPRTTLTLVGNSPANSDKAWQSPAELLVNGIFDTVTSASDEGHLYPIRTGASVTLSFGTSARVDEVRVYSAWRDAGRVDVGVASVDVCDGEGNWTSLAGSELPFADGGTSVGWRLVFADGSGAPLAASATAVRVVFGTMDNDWTGIAEMEVLGAYSGTHTVTFCDENGDPLPGVPPQTVTTGTAATAPDPSLVPEKAPLVFVGWDVDISAVFEDLFPRPVYGTEIQYSRNGSWVRTPLAEQAAELAPASSNLVRRPTTSMTLEGAEQQVVVPPNLMVNGVFEGHFDTSKEDIDVYIMRSSVKVTFDFVAEARVDAVRVFSTWSDDGRNDIAVNSVSVRDAVGTWRTLEGSALPFANTSGIALQSVFSDPSGAPLARGATAIEIDFGAVENTYIGMAEIEILGELTGVYTVTFCDENGDPLPGVAVQTVAAGHAATAPDPSVVPPKEGFVFAGWSVALDTVLSNIRPRPVYAAPGAVLVSSGLFRTGSAIPFGLNVLAESGAVAANGAVAMSATRDPGYNNANTNAAVLVDGRFVFANGDGDVAAIKTGAQFVYELPSPRDVDSVGFYTFWSDGGRDGFSFSSIAYRTAGDPNWKTVSFDEVRYGLGDNFSHGSYFVSVSRAGGPLLTNAVAVRIPFPAMDNSCAGVGEIQALRAPVAAPRAAWTGETWSGTVRRPGGGSLLRRGSGTTASFVRNGAAPDAAALAALADGVVSESSAAVCPVATDAIFEALFDAPERVSRIELWTNGGGAHDGLAVNEVLFRRAGSAAFEPNDDMEPFRFATFEADGDDASSGRQHVVIEAADGGLLAADATGVRIWFGRADNDRTDLQELEIFTDVLPGTLILIK